MTSITISVNKAKTNVIMGNEIKLLWGQTYITDYIGNVKYQISRFHFTRSIRYKLRNCMDWRLIMQI